MALVELRRPENVAGDFFVDSTCIDCDLCRQIAPDSFKAEGEQSIVYRQPGSEGEVIEALKALVTCPTASIGTVHRFDARPAVAAYPEPVVDTVFFCGFASESSFGAASYLIVRPEGNVLVDSPRFARPLARAIQALGGIRSIFLTHRDDVADHQRWANEFGAERIMHARDITTRTAGIERALSGDKPVPLAEDLLVIPTPGHTRGHAVLLYRLRSHASDQPANERTVLFSGDHLWWSPAHRSLHASKTVCWYSWTDQIRSVERLLAYPFEWVLPGHGRRAHGTADEMRQQLLACAARMRGLSEL